MAQENSDLIRIKSRLLPMFKGQIFGSSLSVISASIIYLFFYKTNGYYQHLWYIVTLVIAVLRVGYCILYTQRFYNHDSVENQKVFENHYALLILFSAAIWGLSLFVFYPHAQNEDLVIPAIIPIGVLISALANLGTSKKVSYAFIGGLLSTYIAYFIFSWSSLSIVMTITGVLFIFSLKKSSDRSFSDYEALQDMLEQSRENLRLKEELEVQKIVTIQASKLASLGEMAGGIAHEINNPIAIIKMQCQILLRQFTNGNLNRDLIDKGFQRILDTIARIQKVTSGLLMFARDNTLIEREVTSAYDLVNNALNLTQEKFKSKNIKVINKVERNNYYIKVNESALSQVVINLLNNSFYFINGLDSAWIEIESSVKDNSFLEISFIDSGEPILPEIRDRIFEPFFSSKPIGAGTGLGLSVSKSILKDHEGDLYLREGEHPCFVLRIPLSNSSGKQKSA